MTYFIIFLEPSKKNSRHVSKYEILSRVSLKFKMNNMGKHVIKYVRKSKSLDLEYSNTVQCAFLKEKQFKQTVRKLNYNYYTHDIIGICIKYKYIIKKKIYDFIKTLS